MIKQKQGKLTACLVCVTGLSRDLLPCLAAVCLIVLTYTRQVLLYLSQCSELRNQLCSHTLVLQEAADDTRLDRDMQGSFLFKFFIDSDFLRN